MTQLPTWLFILGGLGLLCVGFALGILMAALCAAGGRADEDMKRAAREYENRKTQGGAA